MMNETFLPHQDQAQSDSSIWHAFGRTLSKPLTIRSAQGVMITDEDGRSYLDAMAGLWCVNVGYGQERIAKKAYEQMVQLPYYPLSGSHEPAQALAAKINEWLTHPYQIFFSNSGSEANEIAFKIARQYHALNNESTRYKIISRYRAYHGATLGALSATGQHQRKFLYEPLAPGFLHVHPPDTYRDSRGMSMEEYGLFCAENLEKTIVYEGEKTVAAFIMEPIITGGGILIPPDNYLERIAEVCQRHGVLLIIDEVICGFGRTGKRFGHQHTNVIPDIVTMAKGLTSGYAPLSATAVRKEIYEVFLDDEGPRDRLRHVNTFGGHPVSCAVALENLTIMEELDLVHRSEELGAYLLEKANSLYAYPFVGDIRVKGLLMGIELVKNRLTKEPLALDDVQAVLNEAKAQGILLGKNGDTVAGLNNVIVFSPPLIITKEQIDTILDVLHQIFQRAHVG